MSGSDAEPPTPTPEGDERSRSLRERREALRTRSDETRRTLEHEADVLRARHRGVQLAFEAYERDRGHAGALLAGGLAYRLFLWLVPMALVVASAIGLIADLSSRTTDEVAGSAGLPAALTIAIADAGEDAGRGSIVLLVIGLWAVFWAGKAVVKALRLLAGVAWQIRPGPLSHSVRVSAAYSGIMLGFLALPVLLQPLYSGPFVTDLVVWVATPIAVTPVLVWVLAWLPHPDGLRWIAFLPGAALVAVGLQLLRIATSLYFVGRLDRVDDLYGAIGIATVFMVWLFVIGRLVVAATAVNAEVWRSRQPMESV